MTRRVLRLCTAAVAAWALTGCAGTPERKSSASRSERKAEEPAQGSSAPPAPEPLQAVAYAASPRTLVGRVISVDVRTRTVIVKTSPYAALPQNLDGRMLLARTDVLETTARLAGTAYRQGRMLGARLLSGRPQPGDEVVLLPAEEMPGSSAPAPGQE